PPLTTSNFTLSLHDALSDLDYFSRQDNCVYKLRASGPEMVVELRHCPDSGVVQDVDINHPHRTLRRMKTMITKWGKAHGALVMIDRKSTRLNSSHVKISYAV